MNEPKPEPHFKMSIVIDGATFSAEGPRSEVLRLYAEWKVLSGLDDELPQHRPKAAFNAPRLASR